VGSIDSRDLLAGSTEPEDRIQGTDIDFGDFRVRKYQRDRQTILEFAGAAGSGLWRELERLATRCRGNLGIDLSEAEGITPQLVPVLERIRKRMEASKRALFLCNPPSKLIDVLTLRGVAGMYTLVGGSSSPSSLERSPGQTECATGPPWTLGEATDLALPQGSEGLARAGEGVQHPATKSRKAIAFFDQSLKRTELLERGLNSAARCVRKILPLEEPSIPGYRFAFTYRQSEKVGGDFFDFIHLERGCLGISIGDMSGKGLEAAILMCLAKKVIAIRAQGWGGSYPCQPQEVLSRANEDLHTDLDRSSFVTAIYAVLDAAAGTLRFARAGHERPIWFAPAAGLDPRPLMTEGMALGIVSGNQFREQLQEHLSEFNPGSRVLFYTDGLIDALNSRRVPYSRDRLLKKLCKVRPEESPGEILESLFEDISRHTGDGLPEDDMTAVVIARD